jgi:hypothetical protein
MGTHGATVLMIAASKGHTGILRVLEAEGIGISTMTDGPTASSKHTIKNSIISALKFRKTPTNSNHALPNRQ